MTLSQSPVPSPQSPGDAGDFSELRRISVRVATSLVSASDLEDVVQNVMLATLKAQQCNAGPIKSLDAFVVAVTRRRARDVWRRQRRADLLMGDLDHLPSRLNGLGQALGTVRSLGRLPNCRATFIWPGASEADVPTQDSAYINPADWRCTAARCQATCKKEAAPDATVPIGSDTPCECK